MLTSALKAAKGDRQGQGPGARLLYGLSSHERAGVTGSPPLILPAPPPCPGRTPPARAPRAPPAGPPRPRAGPPPPRPAPAGAPPRPPAPALPGPPPPAGTNPRHPAARSRAPDTCGPATAPGDAGCYPQRWSRVAAG